MVKRKSEYPLLQVCLSFGMYVPVSFVSLIVQTRVICTARDDDDDAEQGQPEIIGCP